MKKQKTQRTLKPTPSSFPSSAQVLNPPMPVMTPKPQPTEPTGSSHPNVQPGQAFYSQEMQQALANQGYYG